MLIGKQFMPAAPLNFLVFLLPPLGEGRDGGLPELGCGPVHPGSRYAPLASGKAAAGM